MKKLVDNTDGIMYNRGTLKGGRTIAAGQEFTAIRAWNCYGNSSKVPADGEITGMTGMLGITGITGITGMTEIIGITGIIEMTGMTGMTGMSGMAAGRGN